MARTGSLAAASASALAPAVGAAVSNGAVGSGAGGAGCASNEEKQYVHGSACYIQEDLLRSKKHI